MISRSFFQLEPSKEFQESKDKFGRNLVVSLENREIYSATNRLERRNIILPGSQFEVDLRADA